MRFSLNGYVTSNENAKTYRRWGYDVCCPQDIREKIAECAEGEELIVELNSGGGSVYAGIEMYTLIRGYKGHTVAEVQSMAGSAMSVVMAGFDEVLISPPGNVMIHRASTIAWGNSGVMKETKQMLDTIDESILTAYDGKVKGKTSKEELAELMRNETFLTAERAVELGLADGILPPGGEGASGADPAQAVASVAGVFANLPPIEDLRRMEREAAEAGGEAPAGEQGEKPQVEKLVSSRETPGDQNNLTRSEQRMDGIETKEQLAEAFPELVAQIRAETAENAAKAERERLLGIDEMAVGGFEDIINAAKADPSQNAGTVAQAIIKAQKEAGEAFLGQRKKDAGPANKVHGAAAPKEESGEDGDEAEAKAAAKKAVDKYYGKEKEE